MLVPFYSPVNQILVELDGYLVLQSSSHLLFLEQFESIECTLDQGTVVEASDGVVYDPPSPLDKYVLEHCNEHYPLQFVLSDPFEMIYFVSLTLLAVYFHILFEAVEGQTLP